MSNTVNQQFSNSAQLEKDKKSIYMHPLFPLLKLLLEKCELATLNPESINQENFNQELKSFIDQNEENLKPINTQNKVIDELILKSIQVLRIHLLELEKVNELCKNFCERYISCLKIKLNSDNIFKNEFDTTNFSGDDNNENFDDTLDNDDENLSLSFNNQNNSGSNNLEDKLNNFENSQFLSNSTLDDSCIVSNILNSTNNSEITGINSNTNITGNTPLSQIGCNELNNALLTNNALANIEFDDDTTSKRKTKRGILPKNATNIMKHWLFQHIVHPYPTEDEKKQIALQTNLTLIQVNNWFINARRRILQPMLEASNPDMAKKKKSSAISSKPYQNNRYWPPSLVNIALKSVNSPSSNKRNSNNNSLLNDDLNRDTNNEINNNNSNSNTNINFNKIDNNDIENDIDIDDDEEEDDEEDDEGDDDRDNKNNDIKMKYSLEHNSLHNNLFDFKNSLNTSSNNKINRTDNMCHALKVENLLNNDNYYNYNHHHNHHHHQYNQLNEPIVSSIGHPLSSILQPSQVPTTPLITSQLSLSLPSQSQLPTATSTSAATYHSILNT